MPFPQELPAAAAGLLLATVAIALLGTRLSGCADRLADRTGLGEAFIGAAFLGATTSLPGIVATVTAAMDGHASLAVSTAVGGIAAQTAFLAVADIVYRRANLEHAAASLPNMLSGALLIVLLGLLLAAMLAPGVAVGPVHAVTVVLPLAYAGGLRWVQQAHERPMWHPRITRATRQDRADPQARRERLGPLLADLALTGAAVAFAGWIVARSAEVVAAQSGLSETLVGGALVAVSTSLPELVTTVAAVKRGALTLAVGGILGGNAFDTLFAAMADIAYARGTVYRDVSGGEPLLVAVTIVMTGVLLMGLLHRERSGPANIGIESVLLLVLYAAGLLLL
ncbi:MAG: sodium:calcium antiporter [Ectothiorhodospiraceae bacterium]|jgi:cation:H+ antiporter